MIYRIYIRCFFDALWLSTVRRKRRMVNGPAVLMAGGGAVEVMRSVVRDSTPVEVERRSQVPIPPPGGPPCTS
jgi:hypothetical protein